MYWRTSPVNYIGRIATGACSVGGIAIQPEDQIVLVLPWAKQEGHAQAKNSLAFGAGAHMCAGQALALAIGDAWLSELKTQRTRIRWAEIKPDRPVTAVFRQYRTQ
jgi:cytochrome P450